MIEKSLGVIQGIFRLCLSLITNETQKENIFLVTCQNLIKENLGVTPFYFTHHMNGAEPKK